MRRTLPLFLLLIATITVARAQCGCPKLRVAIDDTHAYQYRYYMSDGRDTATVNQHPHRWTLSPLGDEGTAQYDPKSGQAIVTPYDDRPYVLLDLLPALPHAYDPLRVQIEVTEVATHRRMLLDFNFSGIDGEYNLLFDFAPGRPYTRFDLNDLHASYLGVASADNTFAGFRLTPVAGAGGQPWLKLRKK